jgi:hypothetical protein
VRNELDDLLTVRKHREDVARAAWQRAQEALVKREEALQEQVAKQQRLLHERATLEHQLCELGSDRACEGQFVLACLACISAKERAIVAQDKEVKKAEKVLADAQRCGRRTQRVVESADEHGEGGVAAH